jgi:hypothetical protein
MAILRREAFAKGSNANKENKVKDMEKLGFGTAPSEGADKSKPGFF